MKALVAAAWVISQVPWTLRSITVRNPFGLIASAGLRNWPPALLTRTSRRPWRSSRPSKKRPTGSSSRMSRHLVLEAARQPGGQLGRLRQRLLAAPAGDDGGAEPRQLQRRLAPEAAAGAGDDADLPLEQTVPEDLRMRAFSHRRRKPIGGQNCVNVPADEASHVETQPLHEPLAGGTRGATVTVEPLIAGHVDFAREMMVKPGRPLLTAEAAEGAADRLARPTWSRSRPS